MGPYVTNHQVLTDKLARNIAKVLSNGSSQNPQDGFIVNRYASILIINRSSETNLYIAHKITCIYKV